VWDKKNQMSIPDVELKTPHGTWELPLDAEWLLTEYDLLWSPDSRFIAVTGGLNAYTESMRVFAITASGPQPIDPTPLPARDMLLRFPPCKAARIERSVCEQQEKDLFFNFAAISWKDSHTLVLMAEVPCGSLWGGIMCQAMGYEIDLLSGKVTSSMPAREFKRKWQHEMAWRFEVPDPPKWEN
jgi:hypothetical protein